MRLLKSRILKLVNYPIANSICTCCSLEINETTEYKARQQTLNQDTRIHQTASAINIELTEMFNSL